MPVAVLRRPLLGRRKLIDGIRWRMRTGAPWRDLPSEYGPWQTVYGLFRRWQRDGTWPGLLTRLQARADAAGLITWEVNVDFTICRAHQHAAGARRDGHAQNEPPGGTSIEPDDHGLGRSRGGFTTKIHLACEQGQRPLSLLVTTGQRGDSPQFGAVLKASRCPAPDPAVPVSAPSECRVTTRTPPAPTGPTREGGESAARSRSPPTRPPTTSDAGRPAGGLRSRPRGLQGPARGRVRDQPAQAQPGGRHPVRQTRRPLRGHRPDRRDRRMAVTGPSCRFLMPRRPRPGPTG